MSLAPPDVRSPLEEGARERWWAETLLDAERTALEATARGEALSWVLDALCRTIEELGGEGMLASILLLDPDGEHLRHGGAPNLPAAYNAAIDGVRIGEGVGSCGTAAFRRASVMVSDIALDPLWAEFRMLALAHELKACWSTPVLAPDGNVLGTFALYYREPRRPSPEHLRLIALVRRTVEALLERNRAEGERGRLIAELRESQTRFRNLFEGTAEALLVIAPDGHYLDVNQAAVALTGYGADELRGMRVGDLSPNPAGIKAGWPPSNANVKMGGDFELLRKDGTVVPVATLLTPVELATGRVYVSSMRDISERRSLERAQREFIAMVGHELRNPLGAIQGYAQLMLARGSHDARACERIVAQTRQLHRIVNDLLDTYQIEAGRLQLQRETVDLVAIVRAQAEEAAGLAAGHTVRLCLPDGAGSAAVEGDWDPDRLAQILRNLLSNAIKYSPTGSEIELGVTLGPGEARVSVSDHGSGIAPEALPRIFDRFYRAPGASAGGRRGMGVGLYLCRELVQAHGGRLELTSALGRGTTATVVLPRVSAAPAAEAIKKGEGPGSSGPRPPA